MNSSIKLIVSLFAIIIASSVFGQNYKAIAYDYIKKQKELNERFSATKADVHKFSNGNVVVDLCVKQTYTVREEFYAPNGITYMNSQGGISRTHTAYKDHQKSATSDYKVFISRSGVPLNYYIPEVGDLVRYLSNSLWVFKYFRGKEVDGYRLDTYNKIICYSSEGTPVEEKNDLVLYSIASTPNYLYLVGEINTPNGSRSIVRTVNCKTSSYKDKIGELGEIDYSLEFKDKGVSIAKHNNSGKAKRYIIPYESEDENFQVQKVMEGQDLTKPSGQVYLGERYLKGDILKKNEKKAFELFEKAASKNDEKGLYKLAECYLNGWGVTQNASNAVVYFEKCAKLGNKDAMITLSDMYAEGKGISKDLPKALYWKEKLGHMDVLGAQKFVIAYASSTEYEHPNVSANELLKIAQDNLKFGNRPWAKFCYERAISLGNIEATYEYGKLLYEGTDFSRDIDKSLEYLCPIGEKGNVQAQKLLSKIYKGGGGIIPDIKKEIYWIQKAADNNDVESLLKMADAYENGYGVSKDKKQSFAMYEKAALLSNEKGLEMTFLGYALGKGTKKDLDKAQQYFYKMSPELRQKIASDLLYGSLTIKKNKKLGEYFMKINNELPQF